MPRIVPSSVCFGFILFFSACSVQQKTGKQSEHLELGEVGRSTIESSQYEWFADSYDGYTPHSEMLEDINPLLDSVNFLVVFGTWCSDSKREVPHFFKIMDALKFPDDRIELYGVDRSKVSPPGIPQQFHVSKVPTIIVFRNGTELGRIVETPKTNLELDLTEILLSAPH